MPRQFSRHDRQWLNKLYKMRLGLPTDADEQIYDTGLRGSGPIRIPYQYAEQGGQGPYDPLGFSRRSLGRRGYTGHDPVHPVFKFGQETASSGPSPLSLGIAVGLGWLFGRR